LRIIWLFHPLKMQRTGMALAPQQRPYVVVFVGVNGVGKSTSLSKVAAYFMAKHLKVRI